MPAGVFGATVTVPSAFNVNPVGTFTAVSFTSPGFVPIATGFPLSVSFAVNAGVVPPAFPLIDAVVSVTASITARPTTTFETAASQFKGLLISQMLYSTS
ncbi:hypothetical protein D3C85_1677630 [compost metagenome]